MIEIDSSGASNYLDDLIDSLDSIVEEALQSTAKDAIQNIIKQQAPGKLGEKMEINILSPTSIEIVSTASYATYVENGRPGFSAKPGKTLRFVSNGQTIFRKSVGPAMANPFMLRSSNIIQNNNTFAHHFDKKLK